MILLLESHIADTQFLRAYTNKCLQSSHSSYSNYSLKRLGKKKSGFREHVMAKKKKIYFKNFKDSEK